VLLRLVVPARKERKTKGLRIAAQAFVVHRRAFAAVR